MDKDLRKLQLEELRILLKFDEVCKKNKLQYYLLGGTLLGAVRHKGFIPWDDDVDVCMPRPDLDRLMSLSPTVWGSDISLETFRTNSEYRYSWPRLITKNMKIINRSANIPREEYAWIDLIPLDGYPDKGIKRNLHKLNLSFWWNLNQIVQYDELVDQKRKRGAAGTIAVKTAGAFKWLGKVIDYKSLLEKINLTLKKVSYDDPSEDVINFLCAYGFKEVFPRTALGKGKLMEFEGHNLVVPDDPNTILTIIYGGNYMELPPVSERNKHNSEVIYSKEDSNEQQ